MEHNSVKSSILQALASYFSEPAAAHCSTIDQDPEILHELLVDVVSVSAGPPSLNALPGGNPGEESRVSRCVFHHQLRLL
mmetsp:Transcript_74858/g.188477  ORF Transcript_74858/g.188477 Transcript_74858/m.188477 type:complete len:80 (-) Transcript_74858:699-938(-)